MTIVFEPEAPVTDPLPQCKRRFVMDQLDSLIDLRAGLDALTTRIRNKSGCGGAGAELIEKTTPNTTRKSSGPLKQKLLGTNHINQSPRARVLANTIPSQAASGLRNP